MNTGAVENSFCPILVPNRTKLCFQALQKQNQSCLFFLLAAKLNSDKGAAKADFHMMQKLWNALPGE